MKKIVLTISAVVFALSAMAEGMVIKPMSERAKESLKGQKILFIERNQYKEDHHNTETVFEYGEINQASFDPGSAMKVYDVDSGIVTTLIESKEGVVRDPEMSFEGDKIIFSWRKNLEDGYHIYEMNIDGSGIKQLTFADGISDIDPLYLPDGGIVFSSTREPKYCMCNRHIMANLYRMDGDGANITQIGVSTLFEGHSSLLNDGRIVYDRWEYVDRNFGDAQGLWTVNPDGTKHAIYYGNNMSSPGGVIDARAIPGSLEVACIFGSCHDRAWGAFAIIDRSKGVDGEQSVVEILPRESRELIDNGNLDTFKKISQFYEDPFPIDKDNFLISRTISFDRVAKNNNKINEDMGIYFVTRDGYEELLLDGVQSLFDPIFIAPRFKPAVIPSMRDYESENGVFYVQDVYEGTHMEGVERGAVKWLRIVESPPKRSWTMGAWTGEGAQAPAINWHSFEVKRVLGVVPVSEDGSASFEAPAGKHVYFQVLDKDMKMIQSMRSGVSLMPGETNGCIGCHEDRLMIPKMSSLPMALQKKPLDTDVWMKKEPKNFGFMEEVQPILDRRCVKCHDFDQTNREKLVLAGDMNPYFNAAYINLNVKKIVSLVGGGPADIQKAYSWGSHTSILTQVINNEYAKHPKVKLSEIEKKKLYEWMDLNGVYYPVYETAFDLNVGGRSPLNPEELKELQQLTGINFSWELRTFKRKKTAQLSFERPEESPCLDSVRDDEQKYARAVEIIKIGAERLKQTPRGDIESELVMCEKNRLQLENYARRLSEGNSCVIDIDAKRYDAK